MATILTQCSRCAAPIPVDDSAYRHRCGYCGHDFFWAPTDAAVGAVHAALYQRMSEVQGRLDALEEAARQAARAGDRAAAQAACAERVAMVGAIEQEVGIHDLLGIATEEARAQHQRRALDLELARVLPAAGPVELPADSPMNRYAEAMASHDLPALIAAYQELTRQQMDASPEWRQRTSAEREAAVTRATQDLVTALPWVTERDLHQVGLGSLAGSSGAPSTCACEHCGAPVRFAELQESMTCQYCGAVTRRMLMGDARTEARLRGAGLSDQAVGDQLRLTRAAGGQIEAVLEQAAATVDESMGDLDARRRSTLIVYYAAMMHPQLVAQHQQDLLARFDLTPPRPCASCGEATARPRSAPGACALCGAG